MCEIPEKAKAEYHELSLTLKLSEFIQRYLKIYNKPHSSSSFHVNSIIICTNIAHKLILALFKQHQAPCHSRCFLPLHNPQTRIIRLSKLYVHFMFYISCFYHINISCGGNCQRIFCSVDTSAKFCKNQTRKDVNTSLLQRSRSLKRTYSADNPVAFKSEERSFFLSSTKPFFREQFVILQLQKILLHKDFWIDNKSNSWATTN